MAIFGWIVLTLIAIALGIAAIAGAVVSRGFTGKVGPDFWVVLIFSGLFFYISYLNFPFVLSVAP